MILNIICQLNKNTWSEIEEDEEASGTHDDSRHYKTKTPIMLHKGSGNQSSKNVASIGVRIPEAKNNAARRFVKPMSNAGNNGGPTSGLEET